MLALIRPLKEGRSQFFLHGEAEGREAEEVLWVDVQFYYVLDFMS